MDSKPKTVPVIAKNIPAELKVLLRWVVWKWEKRKGKWAKPPRQTNDRYASSNDPHTWCSFSEALAAYDTGNFDGIGIVLPDGIVGIDLDDCVDGEKFTEASKLIKAMLPTYCERSPSGTGIKMLAAGQLNAKLAKTNHSKGVELYDGGDTNRYFTLTGNVVDGRKTITGQREGLFALQSIITEPVSTKIGPAADEENKAKGLEYLQHISSVRADNYDDWLKVGMALSHCDRSDEMLDHWINWSASSSKFDEDVCRSKWDSFRREDGRLLTVSYLERLAKEDGYDPNRYQTFAIRGSQLLTKSIKRDYIVDNFLVRNEPMVIGGASKALKTTVALDLAVSIVSGTKFLGEFEIKQPESVMFLSGESGESTLQDNLKQMIQAKQIDPESLDRLEIGFRLPKLDDLSCVDDLVAELISKEIKIIFVDPLYRSLRVGDSASNVYSMGERLELIAERIHRAGITCILLHHFKKQGRTHAEAPELEDLSQSGIAEFGRQFLLLKRRKLYEHDGNHCLWFSWGGSAGHQGASILEAYSGTNKLGLTWQTTLRDVREWEALQKESKTVEKDARIDDLRERVLEVIGANPGIKSTEIVTQLKANRSTLKEILEALEYDMEIHFQPGDKNAKLWFRNE